MIGSPTGLTVKVAAEGQTYDVGFGGAVLGPQGIHVHADRLWTPAVLVREPSFDLSLYLGLGARVLQHRIKGGGNDFHLGLRGPVGLLFDLAKTDVPIEVFLEAALLVDVVVDRDTESNETDPTFGLNAALGVRYTF